MTCAKQFWKKMYTGWVMSIERQGNQVSTIPDTMCVVPYIAFYVSVCYFTKTRSNLLWFWWLQNLAVHTNTYMLHDQLFLILSHLFFHNAIALPVLKFIFKGEVHPELKLFLIKAEQWEKHISEGLTKIRQRIQKLWIFKVLILWRHMRAALLYVVYCKFHKLPFRFS